MPNNDGFEPGQELTFSDLMMLRSKTACGPNDASASDISGQKPDPITRESISDMAKADVIELLEAHGVDPDGRTGVEKLRGQLIEVMFVGSD